MRPELVANYYSYIALIPIMDDTWQKFVYPQSLHFKIKIYWKFEIMWCFKYWYYLEPQVNLFPVPPQFPPITTYTARRSWANRWRATHVHKIFPPIILPISPSSLLRVLVSIFLYSGQMICVVLLSLIRINVFQPSMVSSSVIEF